MKITELKLRNMIRDILWEAGDPDSDADDAAELRDVAADLEAGTGKKDYAERGRSQQSVDLADAEALAAGIPSFIDWSQQIADKALGVNGIEQIPDSPKYGVPYDAWSQNIGGGHVSVDEYLSSISNVSSGGSPGTPGTMKHYEAWVEETGQITGASASVLATYLVDQGMEDNKRLLQHLARNHGIDPMSARMELQKARADYDTGGVWSDDDDYAAGWLAELGIIPNGKIGKLLRESMYDDHPQTPWVFGPEGYVKRSELTQQYEKKQDIGADSPPEVMIARALSYRASELTNYREEFDDELFGQYAMDIVQRRIPQYIADMKAGGENISFFNVLDSFLNRIDDGGWDDDEILDIAGMKGYNPTNEPDTLAESRLIYLAGLKED